MRFQDKFINFLVEINESKDKDNLLKIIQDELGKKTSIINIKNRITKKIELLEESNSPYTNYTFLILLYKSAKHIVLAKNVTSVTCLNVDATLNISFNVQQ